MHGPSFREDPERALAAYHELGYLVEPEVWSAEECAELVRSSCRLGPARDGDFVPVMHPHRDEKVFLDALRRSRIVEIMERLVGGRVSGIQSQYFYCRPRTPGFTPHQDNFFVQAPRDAFASAWSALDDVDRENGALIVYPGTHRLDLLPVREVEQPDNVGQNPNANRRATVLPRGCETVDLELPRGSVVFLHGHTVHASLSNRSETRARPVLLTTYIRRGVPFRPGFDARREEIDVY